MRVAIAVSGEMRNKPECLRLLRLNVVQPFAEAGAAIDIFVHTRLDEWWQTAFYLPHLRSVCVEQNREREDIIVSSANPPERGAYKSSNPSDRRAFLYQSYLQQYWSMAGVAAMVTRAECQDGAKYDWVVRTRPDVYIEQPLDVSSLDSNIVNVPWNDWWPYKMDGVPFETCCDKFAIGNSLNMQRYMTKLIDLRGFCQKYPIQGEAFTAWQMNSYNIRWHRHDKIKCVQAPEPYKHTERP